MEPTPQLEEPSTPEQGDALRSETKLRRFGNGVLKGLKRTAHAADAPFRAVRESDDAWASAFSEVAGKTLSDPTLTQEERDARLKRLGNSAPR